MGVQGTQWHKSQTARTNYQTEQYNTSSRSKLGKTATNHHQQGLSG